MWIGSLIIWSLPAIWWPLTFINSKPVRSIFIAWLRYFVSNLTPCHWLAVMVLYLISYYDLVPKGASTNLVAVTKEDVKVQTIVWSTTAFVNWLLIVFLGNDAIMFVDHE